MPTITCPKCDAKSKFPEDSPPRRVKCPSCGNIFLSSDGLPPEVRPNDKPKSKSKSSVDLDDREDEDDRPRSRRRRDDDDDDEDDRPRSRRRRDDDDDEDDRPRGRRRRDDDDDDRDRRSAKSLNGQFNRSSLACLLLMISSFTTVGGVAFIALKQFLTLCGLEEYIEFLSILAGVLGLAAWLTGLVGAGFGAAGVRDRGGMAMGISLAAISLLHFMMIVIFPSLNERAGVFEGNLRGGMSWSSFVGHLWTFHHYMYLMVISKSEVLRENFPIVGLLGFVLEVARLVFILLFLRSAMLVTKDKKATSSVMRAFVVIGIGQVVMLLVAICLGVLFLMVKPDFGANRNDFQAAYTVARLKGLLLSFLVGGSYVWLAIILKQIKGRIDYRH